jgi:hypothetical protein
MEHLRRARQHLQSFLLRHGRILDQSAHHLAISAEILVLLQSLLLMWTGNI